MSRYTKTQVTQLSANEQAALNNINKNFDDIEEAIKDTVSRSGSTPTHMTNDLDMNGKRIINLPAPSSDTDPVRRQDVVNDIALVQSLVNATTNAAAQTLEAAASVQEIIQDANVGLVADDLALDENSKIRLCGNNIDKITSTANNISNVNAVADNEANINAVNANKTNINKVANDINRVNLVADDISSVHTVAIDISTVIDVADNKTNIDAVAGNASNINTCASNMSAITGASTQASNAASSAQDAADSAALAYQYANDKINQTHISNCITYIPQDIKLELNNGTLTLKAGSKVYVPNGDGVFDEVTITNDVSFSGSVSGVQFICYSPSNNTLMSFGSSVCSSGNTVPSTQYFYWYDTTNNLAKVSGDYGSTTKNVSFPLAICSASGAITSIDQVFNGFGYIGSTVFALPGVKGLIPNGRNEDGTLKSIEIEFDTVITGTLSYGAQDYYLCINKNKNFVFAGKTITEYQESKNLLYDTFAGLYREWGIVGSIRGDANNKLSNFTPKTVFHALDWNDKSIISGWGMPSGRYIDLTLGASGSTYTAPANGWFECGCTGTVGSTYFELVAPGSSATASYTGGWARASIPVRKGDVMTVYYGGNNFTKQFFLFMYAEGEENV